MDWQSSFLTLPSVHTKSDKWLLSSRREKAQRMKIRSLYVLRTEVPVFLLLKQETLSDPSGEFYCYISKYNLCRRWKWQRASLCHMQFKETGDEGCKGNHSSPWPTAALPRFIFFYPVSGFVQFDFWMSQKQMQYWIYFPFLVRTFFVLIQHQTFQLKRT